MIDAQKLNQFAGVVASDLHTAERSIDEGLANAGILLTNLVSGRLEAGLPAQIGQSALIKLSEAIAAGVECRERLVGVHRTLEITGRKLGADWSAGGPLEPKPDDGSKHEPLFPLVTTN